MVCKWLIPQYLHGTCTHYVVLCTNCSTWNMTVFHRLSTSNRLYALDRLVRVCVLEYSLIA